MRDDDIDLETDELGRQVEQPFTPALGPAFLDEDVLVLDVAELAQAVPKGLDGYRGPLCAGAVAKEADSPDRPRRLRLGRQWRRQEGEDESHHRDRTPVHEPSWLSRCV